MGKAYQLVPNFRIVDGKTKKKSNIRKEYSVKEKTSKARHKNQSCNDTDSGPILGCLIFTESDLIDDIAQKESVL